MSSKIETDHRKFPNFLVAPLIIQFALLYSIVLDIPIFRQVIGFLYLLFIPGFVLLKILRICDLNKISTTLLYSIGLSLAFLMLLGLLLNTTLPMIGFSKPISLVPVLITTITTVSILCIIAFARNRTSESTNLVDLRELKSPAVFISFLLLALSILGTFFMNAISSNLLLLVLLLLISVLPILAVFNAFLERFYPFVIFFISISLLYHATLISNYIIGWDIQSEYFYVSLVQKNSYWQPQIPSNINAMLSIVMLAPIFSIICNLDPVWVFKIFYPIIFSFVPVGLYENWRRYVDTRTAFLSSFLFMSVLTFYNEMPALARQQIAELFLVLLMLLAGDKNIHSPIKVLLSEIFALCLVTSHYGLSYLFLISAVFGCIVFLSLKWTLNKRSGILNSIEFVLIYCVFALAWYIYVSNSSTFIWILTVGNHIVSNLHEFANPQSVEGLNIIVRKATSPLYEITKFLYMLVNFFIFIGIVALLLKRVKGRFDKGYMVFTIVNFAFLLGGILIPYFASAIGTTRLYHVSLLILAPFAVIGGEFIWSKFKLSRSSKNYRIVKIDFPKILSLFLMMFLLFSSGFVYEIARDHPSSISLNKNIDFPSFNDQEVMAAKYLRDRASKSIYVYSDLYRKPLLDGMLINTEYLKYPQINVSAPSLAYFYFGRHNNVEGEIVLISSSGKVVLNLKNLTFYDLLLESSQIYDNGDANIILHSN